VRGELTGFGTIAAAEFRHSERGRPRSNQGVSPERPLRSLRLFGATRSSASQPGQATAIDISWDAREL